MRIAFYFMKSYAILDEHDIYVFFPPIVSVSTKQNQIKLNLINYR